MESSENPILDVEGTGGKPERENTQWHDQMDCFVKDILNYVK